jgi:hypothetical protein
MCSLLRGLPSSVKHAGHGRGGGGLSRWQEDPGAAAEGDPAKRPRQNGRATGEALGSTTPLHSMGLGGGGVRQSPTALTRQPDAKDPCSPRPGKSGPHLARLHHPAERPLLSDVTILSPCHQVTELDKFAKRLKQKRSKIAESLERDERELHHIDNQVAMIKHRSARERERAIHPFGGCGSGQATYLAPRPRPTRIPPLSLMWPSLS